MVVTVSLSVPRLFGELILVETGDGYSVINTNKANYMVSFTSLQHPGCRPTIIHSIENTCLTTRLKTAHADSCLLSVLFCLHRGEAHLAEHNHI